MILLIITGIFLFIYAGLIFFYKRNWQSLSIFEPAQTHRISFISVIVPARNEEKNIGHLLKALKHQSYPQNNFEIIVVDDFSSDSTADVVKKSGLSNLSLINPDGKADYSSKKKAIETAVQVSKGELIVTTDADCHPPVNWLSTINNFYVQSDATFIAAPVKFVYNKSVVQIFQAIDFLVLQGVTAASVAAHFHTMCNGANLAYTKASFTDVKGFEGIDRVATGDDMLLMYKIWKKDSRKVFYLKTEKAIVETKPMPDWKSFFMQRKRWASKTLVYDDWRIMAVLIFVYFFNLLFFVLIVTAFFDSFYWWVAGFLWVLKTIVEWPFVASVAYFYKEQKLMKWFLFFEPLHMFYTVFVGILSQFGKYEWKGRMTK